MLTKNLQLENINIELIIINQFVYQSKVETINKYLIQKSNHLGTKIN
ncbi:MAG: hypothetical protein Q8777_01120 [Candidatus Phytoplasma stylosanthis]|nr:hypothetical protein [Candidatus Phytoplasma stylosanthis]